MTDERLMTAKEIADHFGIHVKTFYRMYNSDETFPRHISIVKKAFRWRRSDVVNWLNTRGQ